MTAFLKEEKDTLFRHAEIEQQSRMRTQGVSGNFYLLIVAIPAAVLIGSAITASSFLSPGLLIFLVYLVAPLVSLAYLSVISVISTTQHNSGSLTSGDLREVSEEAIETESGSPDIAEYLDTDSEVAQQIRRNEYGNRFGAFLTDPAGYLRSRPQKTLLFTVPLTALILGFGIITGVLAPTWQATVSSPVIQTLGFVYLPVVLILGGYSLFWEWDRKQRHSITTSLTGTLRQLSNANETGQPFLESLRQAGESATGPLAEELQTIYQNVQYSQPMSEALIQFNNKYRLPRLARIVKLVQKAQEVSAHITPVLDTAAQLSETQDTLLRERKQQARIQGAIIGVAFLGIIGGLALFDDAAAGIVVGAGHSLVETMFFHAATVYAIVTGGVTGYLYTSDIRTGGKFAVLYLLITAVIWFIM